MARVKVATLFIAAFLSFAGCSVLFEFNAFSALDVPAAPKLSDYQGSGGLSKLQLDLSSAAVVARLKADPATTNAVEQYLVDTYDVGKNPPADADGQMAAVLYADLNLKTTSGDQLVNNMVTTIMTQQSSNGDIKTILSGIIPADVRGSQSGFAAMVNGLLNAEKAYVELGTNLATLGVPQGMNMGDVAQKAAVAYLVYAVVSAVETQSSLPEADAIDQLFFLVNDQPNTITGDTVAPDPQSEAWLQNIYAVAGTSYL